MTVNDILGILDATAIAGKDGLNNEVLTACGSDMMSDVLAFAKTQCVLLTGLCNPQVIRTAEMMDIVAIIFVRGKTPRGIRRRGARWRPRSRRRGGS